MKITVKIEGLTVVPPAEVGGTIQVDNLEIVQECTPAEFLGWLRDLPQLIKSL